MRLKTQADILMTHEALNRRSELSLLALVSELSDREKDGYTISEIISSPDLSCFPE